MSGAASRRSRTARATTSSSTSRGAVEPHGENLEGALCTLTQHGTRIRITPFGKKGFGGLETHSIDERKEIYSAHTLYRRLGGPQPGTGRLLRRRRRRPLASCAR